MSQIARVRVLLGIVIAGLVLSGLTAIPLESELRLLARWVPAGSALGHWLLLVRDGVSQTNQQFPFIAYGTDWLAFGHFVIALAFVGAWRDPVKNVWLIQFGMIACALVVPYALGMGALRGIPWGWRLIDCSFGVGGFIPLWASYATVRRLESRIAVT